MPTNYRGLTIERFLSDIASERVAPAGVSAAAVSGAFGAALCEMACTHTLESHAPPSETAGVLTAAREALTRHRAHCLRLADADAAALTGLFSGDTDGSESAVKRAVGVPFTVADACASVLDRAIEVTGAATYRTVPDAVTGARLAHSALCASATTVEWNLEVVSDQSFAAHIEQATGTLEWRGDERLEAVLREADRRK
jgi:formiminotetrahydrofolate cyclodeaminase